MSCVFKLRHYFVFLQREKHQVEEMLKDVRKNEEEMCQSNQALLSRLEEMQVKRSCCYLWRNSLEPMCA